MVNHDGIEFVEGEEIEEDVEGFDGSKTVVVAGDTVGHEVEFNAPGGAVPEEINENEEGDAAEVDEEDVRVQHEDEESDYCETDLELNEETTDDERDTDERQAYKDICARLDTIPVSRVLDGILHPGGSNITELDLAHHGIGDRGARAVAKALIGNETLTKMDVSDNGIEGAGGAALASMVAKSNISNLDMSENKLGHQVGSAAAFAIGNMMTEGKVIVLNLSRNGIVDADMEPIAEAMKSTSVQRLNMNHNFLGAESGCFLGPAIEENISLSYLDLSWNNIRLDGAAKIAEGIAKNSTLEVANLGWNGFGDAGAAACAEMLKENKTLEELILSNNRIRMAGSVALAGAVSENSTLKVLRLQYNELSDDGIIAWLTTLRENSGTLKTLDLDNVPHSYKVSMLVHDLIDRSPELDVEVKKLEAAQKKMKTATDRWEALQAAQKAVSTCDEAVKTVKMKEEWSNLGSLLANSHWCQGNFARQLGLEQYTKWQKVVKIPISVNAHLIKAGADNLQARMACAHAVAMNPDDRELPVTAAYEGFLASPTAESHGLSDNEVFFLASYAALSGASAFPSTLFALWLTDESPMGLEMRTSFENFAMPQEPSTPKIDIMNTDGMVGKVIESGGRKVVYAKEAKAEVLEVANRAFQSAYGPAYYSAEHVYGTMRAKHPKDQQVAIKAAKEAYLSNGGNAAFDPTHELAELEAIKHAVEVYKKEMRIGKIADGDSESAASAAIRAYKAIFGRKDGGIVTSIVEAYLEEKVYDTQVEKIMHEVEEAYTVQVAATEKSTSDEAAARKVENEAEKRPDFDLKIDFGLREGEVLDARRDPFELLHEFLDRHELRYYDLFVRMETSGNGFLSQSELRKGLVDVGFEVSEEQLNTVMKVFFPPEEGKEEEEEEEDEPDKDDFGAVDSKTEDSITYHMFTHRLFAYEDDF